MPFTLTIRERNHSWAGRGPVRSKHATRVEAEAELLAYVRRNWKSELESYMPDDPNDAVAEYFDEVLESYEVTESRAVNETAR